MSPRQLFFCCLLLAGGLLGLLSFFFGFSWVVTAVLSLVFAFLLTVGMRR